MTTAQQAQGARGEAIAQAHLEANGLVLVRRNFRSRFGELDLVMHDRATLVVVEVRARAATRFGTAAESIGPRKRRRIVLAARALLAACPELARLPMRFDVVALDGDPQAPRIEWIKAAFDAG